MQSHQNIIENTVYTSYQLFTENMFRKIAQNRITQKRNSAILREIEFANDCVKCYLFAQKCSATKTNIFAFFCKNCAKVLQMETLNTIELIIIDKKDCCTLG